MGYWGVNPNYPRLVEVAGRPDEAGHAAGPDVGQGLVAQGRIEDDAEVGAQVAGGLCAAKVVHAGARAVEDRVAAGLGDEEPDPI